METGGLYSVPVGLPENEFFIHLGTCWKPPKMIPNLNFQDFLLDDFLVFTFFLIHRVKCVEIYQCCEMLKETKNPSCVSSWISSVRWVIEQKTAFIVDYTAFTANVYPRESEQKTRVREVKKGKTQYQINRLDFKQKVTDAKNLLNEKLDTCFYDLCTSSLKPFCLGVQ